jgi:hypothetical protein
LGAEESEEERLVQDNRLFHEKLGDKDGHFKLDIDNISMTTI